jgi:hypothetical protein
VAPTLSSLLNKTILVAIPALFADAHARSCRLVAAEPSGLWLVSEDLARAVQPEVKHGKTEAPPAIFVPFAQIAAVLPVVAPVAADVGLKPAAPVPATGEAKPKGIEGPETNRPVGGSKIWPV